MVPATAELFGLLLLRAFLRLPVNSGLQGSRPQVQILPKVGTAREGQGRWQLGTPFGPSLP